MPADYGSMVACAVMKAGEEFGIAPYGVEALSIMRIEKGHVAGNELNGTTTAADLGLGKMMSSKKDYIGRMMASREGLTEKQRQCIVGIRAVNKSDRIRAGSHLLRKNDPPSMANDQGYISSVAWSPMAEQWVGLALARERPRAPRRNRNDLRRSSGQPDAGRNLRSRALRPRKQKTPCLSLTSSLLADLSGSRPWRRSQHPAGLARTREYPASSCPCVIRRRS